jgi:hypothetical protein
VKSFISDTLAEAMEKKIVLPHVAAFDVIFWSQLQFWGAKL